MKKAKRSSDFYKVTYYLAKPGPKGTPYNNPKYQTYKVVEYDQWYFYYCLS